MSDPTPFRLDLGALARYTGRRYANVIYGLVDPRHPDKIAYVGRSKSHVIARYFQHISDGFETDGRRCSRRVRWLAELAALRTPPGLVLIESAPWDADLLDRESYWIAEYKRRGEAWVNGAAEVLHRHKRVA